MCKIHKYTNTRMYVCMCYGCVSAVYMALDFAMPWPHHTSFVSHLGHPSKNVLDTPLFVSGSGLSINCAFILKDFNGILSIC